MNWLWYLRGWTLMEKKAEDGSAIRVWFRVSNDREWTCRNKIASTLFGQGFSMKV